MQGVSPHLNRCYKRVRKVSSNQKQRTWRRSQRGPGMRPSLPKGEDWTREGGRGGNPSQIHPRLCMQKGETTAGRDRAQSRTFAISDPPAAGVKGRAERTRMGSIPFIYVNITDA